VIPHCGNKIDIGVNHLARASHTGQRCSCGEGKFKFSILICPLPTINEVNKSGKKKIAMASLYDGTSTGPLKLRSKVNQVAFVVILGCKFFILSQYV